MDQVERKLTHDIKKINREICCIREAIGTGGGSGIGYSGIVDTYADLPLASAHTSELYYVINTSTGSIGNSYYSNGTTWVSSLTLFDTRITTLENNVYKVTYYEIVSGTSGILTTPTGTTINAEEFGNSGNAILSKINGSNKPTFESPRDSSGNVVTSTLNVGTGAWLASGTYTDINVALIYSVNINAEDFSNLNNFYIVESEQIDTPYTFSTGLTKSVTDIVTANLSTGITAGQSAIGGINASENLILSSTAHATKGKLLFGTSAYDEVNNRLGVNNQSPTFLGQFDCTDSTGSATKPTVIVWNTNTSGTGVFSGFRARVGSGEDGGSFIASRYVLNSYGIANGITIKTAVGTQDIGFTTGAASLAGTGTGPQWLLKADGSLEHHFNLTKYVSYTVDTSSNLTIGLNGGSGSRFRITNYGTGAITGTPTYNIVTDASGNFIETALTGGAALTSTYVGVGDGSNLLSGSANLTYDSGLFKIIGTTEQLRLQNGTSFFSLTTNTVGTTTYSLTGTNPTHIFANNVGINTGASTIYYSLDIIGNTSSTSGIAAQFMAGTFSRGLAIGVYNSEGAIYSFNTRGTMAGRVLRVDSGGGNVYLGPSDEITTTGGKVGIKNTSPGELLSLGTAGTTKGVISFTGNTSGKVIIQPKAIAGTWTMTLPDSPGTLNYVLTTDGAGITSWSPMSSSSYTIVSVVSTTSSPAQTSGEIIILVDATTAGGAVTINLPTAVGNTAKFTIKKIDSGANTVTIDGNTTETIDGSTTATILYQNTKITIVSDNSNWQIIS